MTIRIVTTAISSAIWRQGRIKPLGGPMPNSHGGPSPPHFPSPFPPPLPSPSPYLLLPSPPPPYLSPPPILNLSTLPLPLSALDVPLSCHVICGSLKSRGPGIPPRENFEFIDAGR